MRSKEEALARFFVKGKTMIVPIDHGNAIPAPGLADTGAVIEELKPFANGFVVNYGVAAAFGEAMAGKGICLRTDSYKPAVDGARDEGAAGLFTAEDARDVGADAMMNMLYPGHANEHGIARGCVRLIGDGGRLGIPMIAETLPVGLGLPEEYTVEAIGFAVRQAAEFGADVVKTAFPTGGSEADFRGIVDACFVPVIVLGGAAMGDDAALVSMVAKAMQAGAAGIAIGRNVWQHARPAAIAAGLSAVIHEGVGVDAALKIVRA